MWLGWSRAGLLYLILFAKISIAPQNSDSENSKMDKLEGYRLGINWSNYFGTLGFAGLGPCQDLDLELFRGISVLQNLTIIKLGSTVIIKKLFFLTRFLNNFPKNIFRVLGLLLFLESSFYNWRGSHWTGFSKRGSSLIYGTLSHALDQVSFKSPRYAWLLIRNEGN